MNKNSLSFLRAKEREGEHGRNKIKNAKYNNAFKIS